MLEQWDLANLVAGNKLLPARRTPRQRLHLQPRCLLARHPRNRQGPGRPIRPPHRRRPLDHHRQPRPRRCRRISDPASQRLGRSRPSSKPPSPCTATPRPPAAATPSAFCSTSNPCGAPPTSSGAGRPSFLFLQSALGALPDSQGTFAPLRSDPAKAIAETYYDLATTYGLADSADSNRRHRLVPLRPG